MYINPAEILEMIAETNEGMFKVMIQVASEVRRLQDELEDTKQKLSDTRLEAAELAVELNAAENKLAEANLELATIDSCNAQYSDDSLPKAAYKEEAVGEVMDQESQNALKAITEHFDDSRRNR